MATQRVYKPGEKAPVSGEYEIIGPRGGDTGKERTSIQGERLPPTPKPGQGYVVHRPAHNGAGKPTVIEDRPGRDVRPEFLLPWEWLPDFMNLDFELISADEFDALPEDDEQCFVEFEAICRRNMTRMINDQTSGHFDRSVQSQYMAAVSSVAVECGLPGLARQIPAENDNAFYDEFSQFCLAVQGEVARTRIRGRRSRNSVSVQLADSTRTKIEHYISRLRETIDKSSLPDHRKKALRNKLGIKRGIGETATESRQDDGYLSCGDGRATGRGQHDHDRGGRRGRHRVDYEANRRG
jgi:hypothetical protein